LGVRYVLEGGVQRSGNRTRVTAKLIDAVKGRHLWSERYDRDLTDLFAVQDDITLRIVAALKVRLTEGERSRLRFGRGTRSIDAWANATKGFALFRTLSKENNARAQQLLEKATSIDPSFAWAWTVLAATHWGDARNSWSASRADSMRRAFELANKSRALDDSVPFTYSLLGLLHLLKREYEQAIIHGEKAVALDPSGAERKALLGVILTYAGQPREAATLLERAMRLNPRYPGWYSITLARAYRLSGQLDKAIEPLQRAKQRIPRNDHARVVLTVTYLELGREAEARAEAAEILKLNPKFSIQKFANVIPYKDSTQTKRVLDALRETGLPE
jgi:adenylate cyclase